ncbi:uncharacterized protein BX663DRAFT_492330 [Cokeromyces recurvatus]|uniref:uncharacterized protein n=1 Tax=Cokeromyces recurvatus TaxID=90255 RepID=UPI0022200C0C|nr:uncharacterized protein BX663DRAFT_492330 [Cokeromyces recurvatus]KAI7907898.1 hypothetical protein BX663DRAFT_492330 [Cokeromyces recurvatus]
MRNLFKSNRKKTPKIQLRPDDIKIPLPMISGVQFADMTDSELTILISGRREERKNLETSINNNSKVKSNSSFEAKIATTPLDNTTQPTTSKKSSLPAFTASISAHSLVPLTQSLYRTYVDEKTQVENQSMSSNDSTDDDSSDIEFLLSNVMPSNTSQTKGNT